LKKSNQDLEEKVQRATRQYEDIMNKLRESNFFDGNDNVSYKIKQIEKEISSTNHEIENYKKQIDSLKNKLEFKINLEKSTNLENITKHEIIKNKGLKKVRYIFIITK